MEALHRYDPDRGASLDAFGSAAPSSTSCGASFACSLDAPVTRDGDEELRLLDVTVDTSSPEPAQRAELSELVEAVGRLRTRASARCSGLHARSFTLNDRALARLQRVACLLRRHARARLEETTG